MLTRTAKLIGGAFDGETIAEPHAWKVQMVEDGTQAIHIYERQEPGLYVHRGSQLTGAICPPNDPRQTCRTETVRARLTSRELRALTDIVWTSWFGSLQPSGTDRGPSDPSENVDRPK